VTCPDLPSGFEDLETCPDFFLGFGDLKIWGFEDLKMEGNKFLIRLSKIFQ
jgi:hypothetical protein